MTNQDRTAGARLKEAIHVARVRAGIPSDTQLALSSGVHYDTLMNWFSGRTVPRPAALRQVADAMGARYADLQDAYDGRDPEPPTLVQAIESLIEHLRRDHDMQRAEHKVILQAIAVMLPEVMLRSVE